MTARRLGVLFIFVLFVSCVDIDNPNISTQDYESKTRIVNLSRLGDASVQLADFNESFGTLPAGQGSEYKEFDAGSRTLIVEYPDTFWVDSLTYTDTVLAVFDTLWIETDTVMVIDTTFIDDTTMVFDTTFVPEHDTTFVRYSVANTDTQSVIFSTDEQSTVFVLQKPTAPAEHLAKVEVT